jgi:hypothetical protein
MVRRRRALVWADDDESNKVADGFSPVSVLDVIVQRPAGGHQHQSPNSNSDITVQAPGSRGFYSVPISHRF